MAYPPITVLAYGDPGSGKSHFAATFPKPLLVLCTDPRAKAMPYIRRGKLGPTASYEDGTPYQSVLAKNSEKEIIRVEYYHDQDLKGGNSVVYAYERLEERLLDLPSEIHNNVWQTVVLDSLSFLEYQARKLHQYKLNPESNAGNKQDKRQWYDASSEAIEEFCNSRLTWLPVNVVVLAHIRADKAKGRDQSTWTIDAPGFKHRTIPGAFGEVYVVHSTEEGRYLQTVNHSDFIATTQIMAPDGCDLHYKALWENWDVDNQETD